MDARTTAHFPLQLPAVLSTANTELACVVDSLSLGGVFVHGVLLPIDTRLMLRFTLPHRGDLAIACTARWSTADGTGLQFDGLRAADTYALTRYIRAEGNATRRIWIEEVLRGLPPGESRHDVDRQRLGEPGGGREDAVTAWRRGLEAAAVARTRRGERVRPDHGAFADARERSIDDPFDSPDVPDYLEYDLAPCE